MLSARNVIFAVIVVACLSVVGSILSLAMSPDSGGMAPDSYGTRASGQKAVYDTLRELKLPVARSLGPPLANWQGPTTLVLWEPQPSLVSLEPTHLHRVRAWVESGGRVVLAPASEGLWSRRRTTSMATSNEASPTSIWQALGMPELTTQTVDIESSRWSDDTEPEAEPAPEPESSWGGFLNENKAPIKSSPIAIQADGDLAAVAQGLSALAAPEGELRSLVIDDELASRPTGQILFRLAEAGEDPPSTHILAANFPLGKGQVTVVADPRLLENRWLARGDNGLLAVRLIADGNRHIVWDEFYHGLTLRGNPFALLSNKVYAAIAGVGILCLAIWTWRKAIWLGPAGPSRPPSRRALSEYVDAMAGLFAHAQGGRAFVLAEVREGVLWALRRRLNMSHGQGQLPLVAAALARKDPAAARNLAVSMAALDRAIASPSARVDASTINILKQVTDCLSTNSTSESATKLPK